MIQVELAIPKIKVVSEKPNNYQYTAFIDKKACANFLLEQGMTEEQVGDLTIKLDMTDDGRNEDSIMGTTYGFFSPSQNAISINLGIIRGIEEGLIKNVDSLIKGSKKPNKKDFKEFLYTKRLSRYLTEAPENRGRAFAEKLLDRGAGRLASQTLLHEIKHKLDDSVGFSVGRYPLRVGTVDVRGVAHVSVCAYQKESGGERIWSVSIVNDETFFQLPYGLFVREDGKVDQIPGVAGIGNVLEVNYVPNWNVGI